MPTVSEQIQSGQNDAHQTSGKNVITSLAYLPVYSSSQVPYYGRPGMRFPGINLSDSDLIQSATLSVYVTFVREEYGAFQVHAVDNTDVQTWANSPVYGPYYEAPYRTSYDVLSTITDLTYATVTVQTAVEDILSKTGWSSGNALGFVGRHVTNAMQILAYDGNPSQAPTLDITYVPKRTASGGVQATVAVSSGSAQKIARSKASGQVETERSTTQSTSQTRASTSGSFSAESASASGFTRTTVTADSRIKPQTSTSVGSFRTYPVLDVFGMPDAEPSQSSADVAVGVSAGGIARAQGPTLKAPPPDHDVLILKDLNEVVTIKRH